MQSKCLKGKKIYGMVIQGEDNPLVNMLLQKNLQHSEELEKCENRLQGIFRLVQIQRVIFDLN